MSVRGVLNFLGDPDNYIKTINPSGRRIEADARPNLMMGDMYGMLPRGARPVKEVDGVTYYQDGDNFYAVAYNPDVGEMDVIGFHIHGDKSSDLQVVEEMQGKGIGEELSYLYRSNNPTAPTGGLTEAGERTARKVYERMRGEGIVGGAGAVGVMSALPQEAEADPLTQGVGFEPQMGFGEYLGGVGNVLLDLLGPDIRGNVGDSTLYGNEYQ